TLKADISWREGAKVASFELSVARASKDPADDAVVVWRNPRLRFRRTDRRRDPLRPLGSFVAPEAARRLGFGKHPRGDKVGDGDFATAGEAAVPVALQMPDGTISAQLVVDVELDTKRGGAGIVRCRIADGEAEGETAAEVGDASTLLADPASPRVDAWRAEV